MPERDATELDEKQTTFDKCDPNCAAGPSGPAREGGGTTGAGNLSAGGANRTGGATSGVPDADPTRARAEGLPPDA